MTYGPSAMTMKRRVPLKKAIPTGWWWSILPVNCRPLWPAIVVGVEVPLPATRVSTPDLRNAGWSSALNVAGSRWCAPTGCCQDRASWR
jgi:hypothetical protein